MVKIRKGEKVDLGGSMATDYRPFVAGFVNDLEIGESIRYRNLVLYPVFKGTLKKVGLKLLSEALKEGLVEIKETGVVKEITIINKSKDNKILIMEGDIVKGGAQNRAINATMIVDEDSTVTVPTTCVQQHRWAGFSSPFNEVKHASPVYGKDLNESVNLNMCSSRGAAMYSADQGKMWGTVSSYMAMANTGDQQTKDYASLYESKQKDLDDYKNAFKDKFPTKDESLVGVVILVGDVCKVDVCGDHEMFMTHCPGLLEGCYMDAVNVASHTKDLGIDHIKEFVEYILSAEFSDFDTPNKVGKSLLFRKDGIVPLDGSVLIYNNEVIRLVAYTKK